MTSQGSTSAVEKKGDSRIMLLGIPETKLRLLSSSLACKGFSELAYSHVVDVFMKFMKLAPSHLHIFIIGLSDPVERLRKVVMGAVQCYVVAKTMLLSTQMSGAEIIRVPRALSSLNEEKDDKVLPDRDHD